MNTCSQCNKSCLNSWCSAGKLRQGTYESSIAPDLNVRVLSIVHETTEYIKAKLQLVDKSGRIMERSKYLKLYKDNPLLQAWRLK